MTQTDDALEMMSCRRCGRYSGPELLCVACDDAQNSRRDERQASPWPDTRAGLLAEAVRNGHDTLAFLARQGISADSTVAVRVYVATLEQQHTAALEQERVDAQPELWEACYARAGW